MYINQYSLVSRWHLSSWLWAVLVICLVNMVDFLWTLLFRSVQLDNCLFKPKWWSVLKGLSFLCDLLTSNCKWTLHLAWQWCWKHTTHCQDRLITFSANTLCAFSHCPVQALWLDNWTVRYSWVEPKEEKCFENTASWNPQQFCHRWLQCCIWRWPMEIALGLLAISGI